MADAPMTDAQINARLEAELSPAEKKQFNADGKQIAKDLKAALVEPLKALQPVMKAEMNFMNVASHRRSNDMSPMTPDQAQVMATEMLDKPTPSKPVQKAFDKITEEDARYEAKAPKVYAAAEAAANDMQAKGDDMKAILEKHGFDVNTHQFKPDANHSQATEKSPTSAQGSTPAPSKSAAL